MVEETIAFPDLGLMDQVEALLATLDLPPGAEFHVEPSLDYPGQQVAIDIAATNADSLSRVVEAIRDALFVKFRIATQTSSELDRQILAARTA